MVKGLDLFRKRLRPHEGSIVLIGGAACDDWFARQSLQFRATQDFDIVLLAKKPLLIAIQSCTLPL
jgi:hypothetical protein